MKVVTAEEMQDIDRQTIQEFGISGRVLMERAGTAVAEKVKELYRKRKVIVLCGGGNNGGDGLVAARILHKWKWNVTSYVCSPKDKLSPDCLLQYQSAVKKGVSVEFRTVMKSSELSRSLVVDALLGTGINKTVRYPLAQVISVINSSRADVLAVDIPSGISSDNGQVMGEAVRAGHTITFGLPKIGHKLFPGAHYTGKLDIQDIGFPEELTNSETLQTQTIEQSDAALLLPERFDDSHKGDYGHILLVAGSKGKTGAAMMAAEACLRSGAGMITIGVPETLIDVFQARVTEEMVLPLADNGDGSLSKKAAPQILRFLSKNADILAIGPGIGLTDHTVKIISDLVQKSTAPMVIDADGLNSLSRGITALKKAKAPVILTPHPGEMARLIMQLPEFSRKTSESTKTGAAQRGARKEIESDRIGMVRSFSKIMGVCVVLKGAPTVVAESDGSVYINTTGNPGMATAGSGDVLTGMIAAILGQGLSPCSAAILGPYLHGLAGDFAAAEFGMHSLIASDITAMLPKAFSSLHV
ncbi:MAG: NAD(P)H-hydrate dehydratase [Nitrospiraceae bacterium]|nr:MAG: NAD(P)H-hydrate dehydratase [Nitrospiraceae bacterium]